MVNLWKTKFSEKKIMKSMNEYHRSVLLKESVEGLAIDGDKKQIFVDLTFGGGGHSGYILEKMSKNSKLFAFDQDIDAFGNKIEDERLTLIETNFRYFDKFIRLFEIYEVDGILADLGVSSFQFDEGSRGFSYKTNEKLDMRMNRNQSFSAIEVVNEYSEKDLVNIFSKYGEIRNSKQLANKIVQCRQRFAIEYSDDLIRCIEEIMRGNKFQYLSQLFQAIRIEVNDEMNALAEMLRASGKVLKKGGRLSIISFHSLEDRLVKNMIKKGNPEGKVVKDDFGNIQKPFKEVVKGIISPSEDEIESNVRARSAKLRIAEKL